MTKEEETIERLNKLKNRKILYGNRAGMIIEEFKTLQEDLETVLNMLKEKDREIEKYKNMIIEHKKQLRQSGIYGYDYDLKID